MPTINLNLHVQPGTDALHRVVCVCHRRGIEILALSYAAQQIRLTIAGDDRQMRQIDRWLAAPINVFDVDRRESVGIRTAIPAC